jgi:SAM-dependent methyltransferase
MSVLYSSLDACVLCGSARLRRALALAPMPIATPNFRLPAGVSEAEACAGVPLDLNQCEDCGHVQVGVIGNPELQYRDYVYETSLSPGLDEHFASYARDVVQTRKVGVDALVVEIGSNDGTLLAGFRAAGMRVQGVDPARRIAEASSARGIPTIAEYFSPEVAQQIRAASGAAAIIVANNVIANVPDLSRFAQGIESLLAPDGIFVFETQYGPDVVERMLLDTVYHEHISYFFTKPAQAWLASHGLELIDVVPIATKGGSFRVFAQKSGAARPVAPAVTSWVERERSSAMFAQPFFDRVTERLAEIGAELRAIVDAEHRRGGRVAGFGVSVGASTLLAQFKLGALIDFFVDDDANKGPYLAGPGYRIPVLTADALYEQRPRSIVIFAWRYADQIAARHAAYLGAGGSFVVPLPRVRVVRANSGSAAAATVHL